jgi:hypothetical protein
MQRATLRFFTNMEALRTRFSYSQSSGLNACSRHVTIRHRTPRVSVSRIDSPLLGAWIFPFHLAVLRPIQIESQPI